MGRRDLSTAFLLLVIAAGYFSLSWTDTLDLYDEGYLLERSAQVAGGAVPHRDFVDIYGPGVLALTGAAFRLGGGELIAIRLLVVVFKLLAVVFGFAIARTFAPRWAAVLATLLAIAYWGRLAPNLNTPYAALFTLPLAQLALFLLIRARGHARQLLLAGVVAGSMIVFKQSLGLMLVYGMFLSIVAVAIGSSRASREAPRKGGKGGKGVEGVEGAERAGRSASATVVTAGFVAAALLPLLPTAEYLSWRDYALHFAPMHLIVCGVAALSLGGGSRGGQLAPRSLARQLAAFGVGVACVPAFVVALYAAWGGLGALFHDMFSLPLALANYYTPAALPPLALFVVLVGVLALVVAALQLLAHRTGAAVASGATGAAAIFCGRFVVERDLPRLFEPDVLFWRGPFAFEGVLLPALLLLGALLVALRLRDPRAPRVELEALLPLLLTSSLLCFEVFPRAAHNLWILHGALTPMYAWVFHGSTSVIASAEVRDASRWRRVLAGALVALVPFWLVGPIVRTVFAERASEHRELALPHAAGISLPAHHFENQLLGDFQRLIGYLERAEPRDAPLLLLTNQAAVPLFSGRRDLLEEHDYALFLAGWGMLPEKQAAALDSAQLLDVVRRTPDVLVVHRPEPTALNRRRALSRIRRYVESDFRVVAVFGEYRILRRSDRATVDAVPR